MDVEASVDPRSGAVGSFYIRFSRAPIRETVPVERAEDPKMLLDLDDKGGIVGVEVLAAGLLLDFYRAIVDQTPEPFQRRMRELCHA